MNNQCDRNEEIRTKVTKTLRVYKFYNDNAITQN